MANQKENSTVSTHPLHELYIDELKDILGAERQLLKGLKKMKSAANSESLQNAFQTQYEQTEEHIERNTSKSTTYTPPAFRILRCY